MPESPEIDALATFVNTRVKAVDPLEVTQVQLLSFNALKTVEPPLEQLVGTVLIGAARRAKFLILEFQGERTRLYLAIHFSLTGWPVFIDRLTSTPLKFSTRSPRALRIVFRAGCGLDVLEYGSKKSVRFYLSEDLESLDVLANLGPEALDLTFEGFSALLDRRMRIKNLLQDQHIIAGIGNGFSDEILYRAHLSPYKPSANLNEAEQRELYLKMREVLTEATATLSTLPPDQVKAAKKRLYQVHAQGGKQCAVCNTTIATISAVDHELQYCPGCQTGGKRLNDRRMDRLLK